MKLEEGPMEAPEGYVLCLRQVSFFATDLGVDLNVTDKASLHLGLFKRSRKASQDSLTLFTVNVRRNQFYSLLIRSNFRRLLPHLPWSSIDYKPWLSHSLSLHNPYLLIISIPLWTLPPQLFSPSRAHLTCDSPHHVS